MASNIANNRLDTFKSLNIGLSNQKNPLEPLNIDSSSSYSGIINNAIQEAQTSLQRFAASDSFTGSMNTAFGTSWDASTVSKLQQSWLKGNFGDLPQIKISSSLDVIGANGAYASKTDTIYLSQNFVERNAQNIGAIKSVLLEEIGHAVDARINFVDAAGDEGDIFSSVVLRKNLSSGELITLKAEDDSTSIFIDGKLTQLELSLSLRNRTEMLLGNRVDFNGDGRTDFLRQEKGYFADDRFGMLETHLSNGDGSFRKAWVSEDASRGFHGDWTNLIMGDFNGDGRTDFLRQEKGALASDQWWMFETFISNGDGSFTTRSVMHDTAMNGDLTNIFVGDFNGDGRSDFIRQEKGHFANDAGRMLETYLSNGDGSFRKAWVSEDASRGFHGDWTNLYMGDFNGDGRTDFLRQEKGALASDQWWMFETFISNGDGSFTSRSVMHDTAMNGDLTNIFVGDFNGDGRSDFVRQEKGHFANDAARMLETFLSNPDGSFRKAWEIVDPSRGLNGDLTNLFVGDFNGDGRTDLLRQEKGSLASNPDWMFETYISNGDGSFNSRFVMHDTAMNGDLTKIFVGDFDGNGRSDFIRQERGSFASDNIKMLETYTSNSNGSFTKRWQVDQHAMHGDLTNLFTNNEARYQANRVQGENANKNVIQPNPNYIYKQSDYLNTLYQDNVRNSMSRTDHSGTSAFDSVDGDGDGRVYALVGGEVIEAKNGKNIQSWGYNGTIAIYNKELDKTFIYWHFSEGSINESIKGKTIDAGSLIGIEGTTGVSTGVHTHVEVHQGRKTVNMSNPNNPIAPANSGRLNLANVFQEAVRKGLVKLYQ